MAEMEKEGRPPENKRSRKPAHPVKREINEEMKVKGGVGGGVCAQLHVITRGVVVGSVHVCRSSNQASSVRMYDTLKAQLAAR